MSTRRPLRLEAPCLLLAFLIAASGPAAAVADEYGAIADHRREQDYISALTRAIALLPDAAAADSSGAARTLNLIAWLAYEAADNTTARVANRSAVALAEALGPPAAAELAAGILLDAMLDRRGGNRDALRGRTRATRAELEERVGRAAALLEAHPDSHRIRGHLLQFRANVVRTFAGSAEAVPLYEAAADYRRRNLPRPNLDLADNLVWLGWNLNMAGRRDEAFRALDEATAELEALGLPDHLLHATILGIRFDGAAIRGEIDVCHQLALRQEAIERAARPGFPFGEARINSCPTHGSRRLTWSALQQGDEAAAFGAWVRGMSPVTNEYLRLGRHLRAGATDLRLRLGADHAVMNEIVGRFEADDGAVGYGPAVRYLRAWADLQSALRDAGGGVAMAEPTAAEVAAVLEPGEAVLGLSFLRIGGRHVGDTASEKMENWAVVLRPDAPARWILAEAHEGEPLARIVAEGSRVAETIRRAALWPTRVGPDPDLDRGMARVAERVVGEARDALEGVSTLITVGIPLSVVLPFDAQNPWAVVHAPSVDALIVRESRLSGAIEADRSLIVGVAAGRPGLAAISPAAEVDLLRGFLPGAMVLEDHDATRGRIRRMSRSGELAQVGLAHFVAHTWLDRSPGRNAIILSDGLLDAGTLFYGLDLRPATMVLSGCSSLGGGGHIWEEFHGLAQVALGAGVKRVIASRWDVDDRATTLLMERFYRHLLGRGLPQHRPARALAEASQWLRKWEDENGDTPFAHPVYWAGFVLYGAP